MIKYISTFSVNTLHSMVNRGLLQMLMMSTKEPVSVVCTRSTADILKEAGARWNDRINIQTLRVNARPGRTSLLLRYLESAFHNVVQLMKSRRGDTLIYNQNNVFSIRLLNLLACKFYKGRRIFTVCHSELEYLDSGYDDPRAYKRFMKKLTREMFIGRDRRRLADDFHFIVLGDGIKEEMAKLVEPDLLERVHTVDHPVIEAKLSEKTGIARKPGKLRIGTVGIMNRPKGSKTYVELLSKMADRDEIEFYTVGQIQSDADELKRAGVITGKDTSEALPHEEFAEMVENLDYILLLYPSHAYKLTASGALLDSLRFGKPLIALNNAYFNYFFNKFGSFGRLAKDTDEIIDIISTLKNDDKTEYDYESILHELSPECLAPKFGAILKGIV